MRMCVCMCMCMCMCMCVYSAHACGVRPRLHVLPHAAACPLGMCAQHGGLDDALEVERRLVQQGDLAPPACHIIYLYMGLGTQGCSIGLQARAHGVAVGEHGAVGSPSVTADGSEAPR